MADELTRFLTELAENFYQKAFSEFKKEKSNCLIAAKIMARFYFAILKKIRKKDYPIFQEKVSLTFFEKTKFLFWGEP